jgi:DNA polymerase III subunit gamma/tau
MVYYRKYRPQTIDELDSTAVREKLTSILKDPDNIPHAFLFTGPKGLGKTSTARIIAKVVNCIGKKTKRGPSGIEPCNDCEQCKSITNGSNLDVLEIDAASNRGIDEIRDLKEKIKLTPISALKKVYIIDEVHMLTTEAFNALLKTLEEPPQHALFMLCTTEPQKVPMTILSRSFHITFRKATSLELIRSFSRIVKAEKIAITPEALEKIASMSEGGFRDGVKMLEEIHAIAGTDLITPELVEKKYAITGLDHHYQQFIHALEVRETKVALSIIAELVAGGNDVKYFLEYVVGALHTYMLQIVGVVSDNPDKKSGVSLSLDEVRELLLLFSRALAEMRYSVLPQLPVELAVIEWSQVSINKPILNENGDTEHKSDVMKVNAGDGNSKQPKNNVRTTVTVSTLRKDAGNIRKIKAMYGDVGDERKVKPAPHPTTNISVLNFSANGEITPEWLHDFWNAIIHEVRKHNHTLAGVLRGCMIRSFDRKALIIETAYSFHREKLDNGKTKETLEQICRSLTGNPVSVTVELKSS